MILSKRFFLTILLLLAWPLAVSAGESEEKTTVAVLPLAWSEASLKTDSEKATLALRTELGNKKGILCTDKILTSKAYIKADWKPVMASDKAPWGLAERQAEQIGLKTGAQVILSGEVFKALKRTFIVVNMTGIETGTRFSRSIEVQQDSIANSVKSLTDQLVKDIVSKSNALSINETQKLRTLERLKQSIRPTKKPEVIVYIKPAKSSKDTSASTAATALIERLVDLGYKARLPSEKDNKNAVVVTGNLSEQPEYKNSEHLTYAITLNLKLNKPGKSKKGKEIVQIAMAVDKSRTVAQNKAIKRGVVQLVGTIHTSIVTGKQE